MGTDVFIFLLCCYGLWEVMFGRQTVCPLSAPSRCFPALKASLTTQPVCLLQG